MKKITRIIASVMLMVAIAFIIFALNHPDGAFPWNNRVTYTIYGIYTLVLIVLYIASFKGKNK